MGDDVRDFDDEIGHFDSYRRYDRARLARSTRARTRYAPKWPRWHRQRGRFALGYARPYGDKTDPTGYQAALDTIDPGALSERDQRIAAALAMVREGRSVAGAARAAQVPRSTLSRYVAGVSKLGSQNGVAPRVRDLVEVSYDVARIAGESIRESLGAPGGVETRRPSESLRRSDG